MTEEEYKLIIKNRDQLLDCLQAQLIKYEQVLKKYAIEDWQTLTLLDHGEAARQVLK